MAKVKSSLSKNVNESDPKIHPEIDLKFKILLKIMSWVVGVSFVSIIILPLFDFYLVDVIVKFLYFIGLINLILFAILEFFAQNIKIFLSKNKI
jgi:hypothetical protein